MNQSNPAAKSVSSDEAQRRFEELLQQVTRDKIHLTIEENGTPVAILTPFEDHARREARRRFLGLVEEIQTRADLSADEADDLAREAVAAVRAHSG